MTMTTDGATPSTDPVGFYLEEQQYHGKSNRTLDAYERILRDFETWVDAQSEVSGLEGANRRVCMTWVHSLREKHKPSTIATYASYVNRFYSYMVDVESFSHNPMALVVEQMPEQIDTNPVRRDIALAEMRSFVQDITHPLTFAVVCTFLKTGMRVGELSNLDLRDLNLQDTRLNMDLPASRAALDGRSEALYVPAAPTRGETYHGEIREASNKRQRSTIIPIDNELREALVQWLAIRPDSQSVAEPLFVDTGSDWGTRIHPSAIRRRLKQHTGERGWYTPGADASENVTPHYFRHFFTTHMRDRIGDRGIVKYLRGDVANDVIETYTHNWGDRVRTRYEANIYSLM